MIESIRTGKIDINNQELFFSILLKGLLLRLDDDISIRGNRLPHIIIHTGSDALYLEEKGYDFSIEPEQISNENYIYQITPRCVVNPGGIDLIPDQLTNPYSFGRLQYESDNNGIYELVGEFRRMPLKMSVSLQYFTDSFRDMLELIQHVITKLSFVRTYNITYMGQVIKCSYKLPESFSQEHLMDMDGTTQDSKHKTMSLDIEIETNLPIYNPETIMNAANYITKPYIHDKCVAKRYGDGPFNEPEEGIILKGINEIN